MKRVLFIGDRDKTDLLFYTAKTLAAEGRKVLIVDATAGGNYEFAYPALDIPGEPQEYDGFEVWTSSGREDGGRRDYQAAEERLNADLYDFWLYDVDHPNRLPDLPEADVRFLVLGCEQTSVRRSVRLLEHFFAERPVAEWYAFYRIWIEGASEPGEAYIDGLLEPFPIEWRGRMTYYPDERDSALKIANQYAERLRIKGLSAEFKRAVQGIAAALLEIDEREARKAWKKAERSR